MTDDGWNYFGWGGISFLKPADWQLSHIEGKDKKGYAVLDDGISCRIQLRWKKTGGDVDVDKIASRQTKILEKKSEVEAGGARITDCNKGNLKGKKLRFNSAGSETFYYILQCKECRQVILLGVFGSEGEKIADTCAGILKSLQDHGSNDKMMWAVFGYKLMVPSRFVLREHHLRSGDLTFAFSDGKRSVFFHKLGLANMLLKNRSIKEWVDEFMEKRYENAEIEAVCDMEGVHSRAVSLNGVEVRWKFLRKKPLDGSFWLCEESNSILGVVEIGGGEEGRLLALSEGVVCH